jgi:hypothetical protein
LVNIESFLFVTYFGLDHFGKSTWKLPQEFKLLYASLEWSEYSRVGYDNEMILLVTNVLNKFGFMFLSLDEITELNGRKEINLQVFLQYHLNNFIFYTKSTLDSIAIILNEVYNLGKSKGAIDLKWTQFVDDLIRKKPRSSIALQIIHKKSWIKEVINWRDEINHRTFNVIGTRSDAEKQKDFTCKMSREPLNMLNYENIQKMAKKYGGGNFTQEISLFCNSWINNCSDLIETLGTELIQNILLFKGVGSLNMQEEMQFNDSNYKN